MLTFFTGEIIVKTDIEPEYFDCTHACFNNKDIIDADM